MLAVAQAFEGTERGGELHHERAGGLQLGGRERGARIGPVQVAPFAAPELRKLGAEACERPLEPLRSGAWPRPAQHRAFERRDGALVRASGGVKTEQRMLEQG